MTKSAEGKRKYAASKDRLRIFYIKMEHFYNYEKYALIYARIDGMYFEKTII